VLEIGTGCGYAAAVLSNLVKEVYSIELIPELASEAKTRLQALGYANITVLQGDGSVGLEEHAPFDAILVAAGAPVIPPSLKAQLAIQGRLVIPVGYGISQELVRLTRLTQNNYREEQLGAVRFVPLKGQEGWSIE
jgi:protein-L-isoaspartate(D-aspartate) O-methyltransferase